ncbi:MAG: hypothetical protein JO347_05225 [Candidatus Eremiobacteraeota bacterium]|nr:hypothetical protein [Candidatus Eremiobacteraeota bacterium]
MKPGSIVLAATALAATAVAAMAGTSSTNSVQNAYMPNRVFGLGEQQVYVIQRRQTIVVRFRGPSGDLETKQIARQDTHSVALTVEGYDSGAAVVAVADDSRTDTTSWPSPSIRADGSVVQAGPLESLSAAGLVLRGATTQLGDGVKWSSSGVLHLPVFPVALQLANASADWQGTPQVQQVSAAGTIDTNGTVTVPDFGLATLHGGGSVSGTAFVDLIQQLVLGSTYTLVGAGNAANRAGRTGTYAMKADYTLALARLVPGTVGPVFGPAGELPHNIETVAPDADIMHGGSVDENSHPAPTDNIMTQPVVAPQPPQPLPEIPLPPVPLPSMNGTALASPPLPPTTPVPTHTPR